MLGHIDAAFPSVKYLAVYRLALVSDEMQNEMKPAPAEGVAATFANLRRPPLFHTVRKLSHSPGYPYAAIKQLHYPMSTHDSSLQIMQFVGQLVNLEELRLCGRCGDSFEAVKYEIHRKYPLLYRMPTRDGLDDNTLIPEPETQVPFPVMHRVRTLAVENQYDKLDTSAFINLIANATFPDLVSANIAMTDFLQLQCGQAPALFAARGGAQPDVSGAGPRQSRPTLGVFEVPARLCQFKEAVDCKVGEIAAFSGPNI